MGEFAVKVNPDVQAYCEDEKTRPALHEDGTPYCACDRNHEPDGKGGCKRCLLFPSSTPSPLLHSSSPPLSPLSPAERRVWSCAGRKLCKACMHTCHQNAICHDLEQDLSGAHSNDKIFSCSCPEPFFKDKIS